MRLDSLIEEVRSLSYEEINELLSSAIELLKSQWEGGLIKNVSGDEAVIIGDIHGDFKTLNKILKREGILDFLAGGNNKLIFLGDVIDRGPEQLESINLVLKLKVMFKDKVYYIRGNHEPPIFLPPYPHDFPYVLKMKFGDNGEKLYSRYFELFQILPHVITTKNNLFLVHGGIPPTDFNIDNFVNPTPKILEYLLWSDPFEGLGSYPSIRGAGHQFGKDITEKFLRENGLIMIIRGHEPCEGYKLNHDYKVLTLFSRVGAPYYNYEAGYLRIPLNTSVSIIDVIKGIRIISEEYSE